MAEAAGDLFGPINAENTVSPYGFDSVQEEGAMTFTASNTLANNGTYSFKVLGDGTNDEAYGQIDIAAEDELYVRCYVYIPADCTMTAQWTSCFPIEMRTAGAIVARLGFQSTVVGGAPTRWIAYWSTATFSSTTNFSLGAWHRLELYYVKKADTGGIQAWIDGTSIGTDLDQTTSDDITIVRIGNSVNSDVLSDGKFYYIDDGKGATTPIGAYAEAGGSKVPLMMSYYRRRRS